MLDEPKFTISQVAEACAYPVHSLRSDLQRKFWRLEKTDAAADANGLAHSITLRRALHIGAAIELKRNDVSPARAYRAALSFVDIFDPELEGERGANGLYTTGWTLLVAYPDQEHGTIMRLEDDAKLTPTSLMSILFPRGAGGSKRSGTFVWLNQIDRQIRTGLGV